MPSCENEMAALWKCSLNHILKCSTSMQSLHTISLLSTVYVISHLTEKKNWHYYRRDPSQKILIKNTPRMSAYGQHQFLWQLRSFKMCLEVYNFQISYFLWAKLLESQSSGVRMSALKKEFPVTLGRVKCLQGQRHQTAKRNVALVSSERFLTSTKYLLICSQ